MCRAGPRWHGSALSTNSAPDRFPCAWSRRARFADYCVQREIELQAGTGRTEKLTGRGARIDILDHVAIVGGCAIVSAAKLQDVPAMRDAFQK